MCSCYYYFNNNNAATNENQMTISIKRSDIKSTLARITGIGDAVYVMNQVNVEVVTWSILEVALVASNWSQRNVDSALIAFNKIAY